MKMMMLAAAALMLGLTGCVSTQSYDQLVDRVKNERDLNDALRKEVLQRDTELAAVQNRADQLEEALRTMPKSVPVTQATVDTSALDEELARLRTELEDELAGGLDGFEVLRAGSAVGVRLDDGGELLFRSGSWFLTDKAKANLDKLAVHVQQALKSNQDYIMRVDGHTDTDPINKLKKQGIEDNTHLAFMRAHAVRDYLAGKGVPIERTVVMACGEYFPVGGEKKLNRRVEIWVATPDGFGIEPGKKPAGTTTPSVQR